MGYLVWGIITAGTGTAAVAASLTEMKIATIIAVIALLALVGAGIWRIIRSDQRQGAVPDDVRDEEPLGGSGP